MTDLDKITADDMDFFIEWIECERAMSILQALMAKKEDGLLAQLVYERDPQTIHVLQGRVKELREFPAYHDEILGMRQAVT